MFMVTMILMKLWIILLVGMSYKHRHCNLTLISLYMLKSLLLSFHYSTVHISMNFKFKQVYLVEGFTPVCILIDAHYTIENDVQHYLWPVRILAKGALTGCLEDSEEDFLPVNNLAFFLTTGAITIVVCIIGCLFHFVRLTSFLKVGKVSYNSYI